MCVIVNNLIKFSYNFMTATNDKNLLTLMSEQCEVD